jgi:hypothetical protein
MNQFPKFLEFTGVCDETANEEPICRLAGHLRFDAEDAGKRLNADAHEFILKRPNTFRTG